MMILWFIMLIILGGNLIYNTQISIIGYVILMLTYMGALVYLFLELVNKNPSTGELISLTPMSGKTYMSQIEGSDLQKIINAPINLYLDIAKRVLIYGSVAITVLFLLASIIVQTAYVSLRTRQTKSADLYLAGKKNKNTRDNLRTFNNAFLVGIASLFLFFISFVFSKTSQNSLQQSINFKFVGLQIVLLIIAFITSAISMSYSIKQKKMTTASMNKHDPDEEPVGYSQNIFTQIWQNLVLFFTNPVV